MSLLFQTKTLFRHWLLEVDEHSIHSPFFFDFYTTVLKASTDTTKFTALEKLRTDLLSNGNLIEVEDFGTEKPRALRKLSYSEIASSNFSRENYCKLFYRIINHLQAKRIVELGTSFGLTTLYLATPTIGEVFTFEGDHNIANVALTNFEYFDKKNIHLIEGNIDSTLANFLHETAKVNFVLMDANSNSNSLTKYFQLLMRRVNEKSVIVINNIHGSKEMEKSWQSIKSHELVYGSIDLYHCGIVFFEPSLNKQHFMFSLGRS